MSSSSSDSSHSLAGATAAPDPAPSVPSTNITTAGSRGSLDKSGSRHSLHQAGSRGSLARAGSAHSLGQVELTVCPTPEDETAGLIGAEGGMPEGDSPPEPSQAPPLPEKIPLIDSEEVTAGSSDSAHSASSDSSDGDNTTSESEAEDGDAPAAGGPEPVAAVTVSAVGGTADLSADTPAADTSSPSEPPPPYPGGPLPGADPYGPPATETRTVTVIQASGNCPKCQAGNVLESFSFAGICLAIWCFPCGLICLFCMRRKRCSHCGESF